MILPWASRRAKYTRHRNPFAELAPDTAGQDNDTFSSVDREEPSDVNDTNTGQGNIDVSAVDDDESIIGDTNELNIQQGNDTFSTVDREGPNEVNETNTGQGKDTAFCLDG